MKRAQSRLAALLLICLGLGCARAESLAGEQEALSLVRSIAQECIGEGETVEDVVLENGVLSLRVDLSGGKAPATVSLEDVARDRAGGIADTILSHPDLDAHWQAIRIYVEPAFAAEYTKEMIVSQDWGRYFKGGNRLELTQASGAAQATPEAAGPPTPAPTNPPTATVAPSLPAPPPTLPTWAAASENASPMVGVINMNHVNVREGAGMEYGRIDTLNTGAPLVILGGERALSGETWYIVRYGETRGFVRSDLVDVTETAPASATPQAQPESGASVPAPAAYADLSDEALRQMLYDLMQEARERQQESALELPVGTYGVGTQIPPGEYAVSTQADLCVVELYNSLDSKAQEQYVEGYSLTATDAVGRMALKEGMSLVVALGSVTLQTFYAVGEPELP